MLALSETWLGTDTDNQVINELVPSGYTIQHISRPSEKCGGGVAVLYKCGFTIKTLDFTRNGMFTHFEHMDCTVISNVRLPLSETVLRTVCFSTSGGCTWTALLL